MSKRKTKGVPRVVVVDLSTGDEYVYVGLAPRKALIAAWCYFTQGKKNTWQYPDTHPGIKSSRHSFGLGDFATLKTPARIYPKQKTGISPSQNQPPYPPA